MENSQTGWFRVSSKGLLGRHKRGFTSAALSLFSALLLAGCGGSGGDLGTGSIGGGSGGGGTTPPAISVTVALTSAITGQPIAAITSSEPGKITATVVGITSPVIVTFTTDVGEIPVATAITDSSDKATVDILAGSSLGAGTIVATLSSGETGSMVFAVGATNVLMGSGTPFQSGVAEVGAAQISAGGTTTVSVSIVDDNGNPFTQPVSINFSSACSTAAVPSATLSSPVTTVNGNASSTYLAQGCVGDDAINVTANAGGVNLSANTTVNVLPASVGSIEFVSATPTNIGIQGTGAVGGSESSTVIFRVLDTNGNPVNGQLVDFSLNTNVGGIAINPSQATSDISGLAQTVINSGTVATSVRVTASVNGSSPLVATQSSQLVVSTGIPDQNSFSLSADILNPEGLNIDGIQVNVTARLADHFNNPVPDGTAVSFLTEGGSIQPSCTTTSGACSVNWISQNPRPLGAVGLVQGDIPCINNITVVPKAPDSVVDCTPAMQPYGGRVTVLATAIGEESFPDQNGNGRFDASEMGAFSGLDGAGKPFDLAEAFNDYNEDGVYNPAVSGGQPGGMLEEFVDFNANSQFDLADGVYNGVLCSIPAHAGCSATQKTVSVRANLVLVMAGSNPIIATYKTYDVPRGSIAEDTDSVINILGDSTTSVSIIVSDRNGQPMPRGTIVKFTPTVGTIVGSSSFTWPNDNHNGGMVFSVSVKGETQPKTGNLLVEVTTPSGLAVSYSAISISIN